MLKKILIVAGFIFLSSFHIAKAEVVFNEIMYDPQDADVQREWVEIHNDTNSDLDLSNWKFLEKIDANNHGLVLVQGNAIVPSGGYALIVIDLAKFLASWSFNGTIYKVNSVTSLNNTGAKLILKNSSVIEVNSYEYNFTTGGAGDGNTLQKISGIWSGATPTPGEANEVIAPAPPADTPVIVGSSSSSGSSSETKNKIEEIKVKIIGKNNAIVDIPLVLQANAFGQKGELLSDGRYFWNFGDGDSKELTLREMNSIKKLTHTFLYSGEYNIYLEYYANYYGDVPDAFERMTVKVVSADIAISKVGDEKDFFIELTNNAGYDTDISNWILSSDNKSFKIPRNTIIVSKKKIILSPKITGFSFSDKNNLKLITEQGNVVFDNAPVVAPVTPQIITKTPSLILPLDKGEMPKAEGVNSIISDEQIPVENLQATPENNLGGQASVINSDIPKNNYSYLSTLVSLIFIGSSAGVVYFIRQKKVIAKTGDDFEILDD
ncbi:MAG: lamin tail domain-containing protein [Candidatus Parcubacteria bacterium]|nr:lamin tail domain-containing protein [Candidatus Parcubacteria bacterium]